jgi:hypothetical protein
MRIRHRLAIDEGAEGWRREEGGGRRRRGGGGSRRRKKRREHSTVEHSTGASLVDAPSHTHSSCSSRLALRPIGADDFV